MAGVAGALAQGIESGFGLARNMALDNERRSQTEIENKRKDEADRRSAADLALRGARETRIAEQGELTSSLNALTSTSGLISKRKAEIEGLAAAAQATGRLLPPELTEEYGQHTRALADIRQKAANLTTRLAGGQVSLEQVSPGDLYTSFAVSTGHKPEDFPKVRAAAADFQSAVEAGNQGLVIQSLNTLMAPQLRRGLGQPSPHGGTIVSKELINLVPAVDANGQPHPNRVFPVLRVTTDINGPDGKPLTYVAPMSTGGGTTDAPMALDISKGFQFLGNLGVALTAAENPAVASKLAAGAQVAGAGVDEFFRGELGLAGAARNAAKPGVDQARVDLVHRYMRENGLDPKNEADVKKAVSTLHKMGAAVGPGVGAATLRAKEDMIDGLDVSDEEKAKMKAALATGVKPESALDAAKRKKLEAEVAGTLPARPKATGTGLSSAGKSAALGGAAAPAKTDDAVDFWARAVIAGDKDWQIGLGRSKSGATLIEAVKRRVPQLAKEMGLDPQDIGSTRAQSAALAATQKDLTKRAEAIELFSSKVAKDMETFEIVLAKAGNDSPILINKPLNILRRQFSDKDLAQLDLAARQVGTEYERLLTGGTLSVAQLHAGAQEDAKKLINGDMPPRQARAIMEVMRSEMKNARAAAHESEARIQERMRGLGRGPAAAVAPAPGAIPGAAPTAAPAAAAAPKYAEGQTATGPGGAKRVFRGGQWVPQ